MCAFAHIFLKVIKNLIDINFECIRVRHSDKGRTVFVFPVRALFLTHDFDDCIDNFLRPNLDFGIVRTSNFQFFPLNKSYAAS